VNTWKVILATIVIFGAGVVTGGLLVRHSQTIQALPLPRPAGQARPPLPPSAAGLRIEFLRRAERDLDLSPAQRERVDRLIKESQDHTHQILEPVSPQLHQQLEQTRAAFLEVLTPEQRARFDQLVKQQQQQMQRFREQHRPHPTGESSPKG
jgi:hypothetical protein